MAVADPTTYHPGLERSGAINLAGIGAVAVFVPCGIALDNMLLEQGCIRWDTNVSGKSVIFGYIPNGTAQATGNVVQVADAIALTSGADTNAALTRTTASGTDAQGRTADLPIVIPAGAEWGFMIEGDSTTGLYLAWQASFLRAKFGAGR